ncbi:TIGR01244 family sulfur transferase [Aquibaculum sediminis]|uniref:TIGR01244 family sulfur transferase n=1 Tax=Aquibaculum sediminis TaxID=3231907 RepID=UPI003453FF5D
MTTLTKLDEGLYVAGQITEADADVLRDHGIVTIVNNRPDGEEAGQPSADEARCIFEDMGFSYHHVPVTMDTLSPEVVEAFRAVLNQAGGPVLAHCRSGMRSTLLWALAEARYGSQSAEAIMTQAKAAGYDLTSAKGLLEQIAAMPR